MAYKLWIVVALVIIVVIALASMIEYIPPKEGKPARLSIVWKKTEPSLPCAGKLSLISRSLDEKCELQADVTMSNCEGKRWYVFEGDVCSGTLVCDGDIRVSVDRRRCIWEVDRGTHAFTLCADVDAKATRTVIC